MERGAVKMKRMVVVALLLVLLLQISLRETEAADVQDPPDNLKQLADMVYQQGTMLAEMKAEMKYIGKENANLKTKMAKQIKLTKETVSQLQNVNKEMSAQLSEVSVIRSTLANSVTELEKLKNENEALQNKVSSYEGDLKILRKEVIEQPKVAFSAGLSASTGPLSGQGVIIYTAVITNNGGAYNPNTGVFTAPTTGVYYFRFTACGSSSGQSSAVSLYRNHERLTYLAEYNTDSYPRHFSGGVVVHLSKGDTVTARLPSGYKLFEDSYKRNIFSGFLLFQTES